jgi:hypothetical protein
MRNVRKDELGSEQLSTLTCAYRMRPRGLTQKSIRLFW